MFLLDMGDPVRIRDLAINMIELSGLTVRDDEHPEGDIEIQEIGLRPGEKLYEELLISGHPDRTAHPLIMKGNEAFASWHVLEAELDDLWSAIAVQDDPAALAILRRLVPGYQPRLDYTCGAELAPVDLAAE